MKNYSKEIKETNLDKLKAFGVVKAHNSIGAKDYDNIPFKLSGYVFYDNVTNDDETGEVETSKCLAFLTQDNTIVATNSPTLQNDFKDILKVANEYESNLFDDYQLIINLIQGQRGKYATVSIIL